MSFDKELTAHQVKWREFHVPCTGWGKQNGRSYPWILPRESWEQALWPGIRSGSPNALPDYLRRSSVQPHTGIHNLKSSWILCANLYFPFGQTGNGRELLAGFLKQHVAGEVKTVDAVELEYAEDGDLHPSKLLGELGGGRGAGQTSPDVAFVVNKGRGLILTENKLVEHSFYPCSARRRSGSQERPGNPDPGRCKKLAAVLAAPKEQCHQSQWGRRYWDLLAPIFNSEQLSTLKCCPAFQGGYQLFRQQALAEGLARSGKYDVVVSCVAVDARNEVLRNCLRSTGISDLASGWASVFRGKARFAAFSHQQWVGWVATHDSMGVWNDWLAYIQARYGYTVSAT